MRDNLCREDKLNSTIEFHIKQIPKSMEKIASLQEDIRNGVQRYPRKNEDIISDTRLHTFQLIYELIRAQYSLGLDCDVPEKYYTQGAELLQYVGFERIGYVNALQYFSLGILLEIPKDKLSQLVELADKDALDDLLFDFLVKSCGLSRNIRSTGFQKEEPYGAAEEIINAAMKSREAASLKLADYVTRKWLEGHADYKWTKAHTRHGYVGLWSFESAVIAKIFNLDDSELRNDNHYPYDLAHYKNTMTFDKTIGLNK